MNKWTQAIQSFDPSQKRVGMGSGNIPYAPGIMRPPSFGETMQKIQGVNERQQMQQMMRPGNIPGNAPQGGMTPSGPGMSGMGQMQWGPEHQKHLMEYLMGILQSTQPGDHISTTGGMVNKLR